MKKSLYSTNYILLKNFIPYNDAIELSNEFKSYCETNNVNGDDQAQNSYSKYNYISFLELLCKKVNTVSDLIEEPVIPTYSYARVYLNNSVLEKHTDRDACEVSISIHLNGDSIWPIYIKTPNNETHSIILNAGDAIMYNGTVAEHWRDAFCGTWYTQLFLHYVRSRGPYFYTYFDKKKKNIDERGHKGSNIFTVSNVVNHFTCNKLITFFNSNTDLCYLETDSSYSNVECTSFLTNNNRCKRIDESIFEVMSELLKAFTLEYPNFLGTQDSGYIIRKITGGTKLHIDGVNSKTAGVKNFVRCLSLIIVLNDDYDGGIFNFPKQNLKLKVKKGEAIMFPPYWTHPHSVTSVGEGQARYTINTWILEKFID
jgi:hypothetical protein